MPRFRLIILLVAVILFALPAETQEQNSRAVQTCTEVRRYPAPEARQGCAVDANYVYAIVNAAIGKYDKKTGRKVGEWRGDRGGPIVHLDSGVVIGKKLYCAHSNFPEVPMMSSVEIWDTTTMQHIGTHSFGIYEGSCTWLDWHDGSWWAAFAHYNEKGGTPGKTNHYTTLVRFDKNFRRIAAWGYPSAVIERWAGMSNSGGSWGADGLLYTTGHDEKELYVLRIPKQGSVLELVRIVPFPGEGQGIAFDRSEKGMLYGISRKNGEVIACKLSGL